VSISSPIDKVGGAAAGFHFGFVAELDSMLPEPGSAEALGGAKTARPPLKRADSMFKPTNHAGSTQNGVSPPKPRASKPSVFFSDSETIIPTKSPPLKFSGMPILPTASLSSPTYALSPSTARQFSFSNSEVSREGSRAPSASPSSPVISPTNAIRRRPPTPVAAATQYESLPILVGSSQPETRFPPILP
jgi:hypothetical protein